MNRIRNGRFRTDRTIAWTGHIYLMDVVTTSAKFTARDYLHSIPRSSALTTNRDQFFS